MSDRLVCVQCSRALPADDREHPPAGVLHCPFCNSLISPPAAASAGTAITAPPATNTAFMAADPSNFTVPMDGIAHGENKPRGCLFALAVFGLLAVSVALLTVGNRYIGPIPAVAGLAVAFGWGIGGMLLAVSPSAGRRRAGMWLLAPFAVLASVLLLGVLLLGFVLVIR